MPDRSLALDAAIRTLCGDVDLETMCAVIADCRLTPVIAVAPFVHPSIRAVIALHCGLTAALTPQDIADPDVHGAVRAAIETPKAWRILHAWSQVVPAGWGVDIADALIDAVQNGTCAPAAAAALIGPCDKAAALLADLYDIAFAVARWGQADPNLPTAWMTHLSHKERERLVIAILSSPSHASSCLPWLPLESVQEMTLPPSFFNAALHAFAEASPVARACHAGLLDQLIAAAQPGDLGALTHLACVMRSDAAWTRVQELAAGHPDETDRIVRAAPWDDLSEGVQTTILNAADTSDICAAVAVAQGRRKDARIRSKTADAFFAALRPDIWKTLDDATQRAWLDALSTSSAHGAVRSLGLRPEILARAILTNDLIHAARRHGSDDAMLRWTLLSVALHDGTIANATSLISVLPTMPPDPGAFFFVASRHCDTSVIASAREVLRTSADLAAAIMLRRCAVEASMYPIQRVCDVMRHALHERSWDSVRPILALLGDDAQARLTPDRNALAVDLALPDRRDALRQTLDAVAALPPEVAVSAFALLEQWRTNRTDTQGTAEELARSLQAHGDRFVDIADALPDTSALRAALLPLPDDPRLADALRSLTRDDPDAGHRLAHALQQRAWSVIPRIMLAAPRPHADAIALALLSNAAPSAHALAADGRTDEFDAAFWRVVHNDPLRALALAMLAEDDPDQHAAALAALADAPQTVRTLAPMLRPDVHNVLRAHPILAAALADLDDDPPSARPTRAASRSIRQRI